MDTLKPRISANFILTQETESKISYYESENKALRAKVPRLSLEGFLR